MAPGRSLITTTRSARKIDSGIEWVMSRIVLRVSKWIRCSSRFIRSRVSASSAPKGSSISTMRGSWTRARQMAARCCMPPESCQGYLFSKPSSRAVLMSAFARSRCVAWSRPRTSTGIMMLRMTLRQASRTGLWKTMPTSSGGSTTALPPTSIDPLVGSSRPATSLSSVDLPQPEGPTTAMNSPSPISRSIGRSVGTSPSRVR